MARLVTSARFAVLLVSLYASSPALADAVENRAVVLRTIAEIWSRGNLQAADALYAADFVCHNLVGPEWRGISGIKGAVESHRMAFPDWQEHVDDIVVEGDRVAVRFTASGTHKGFFAGIPATGRKVTVKEVSFYRLSGGKIVEQWGMPDINGMRTQLRAENWLTARILPDRSPPLFTVRGGAIGHHNATRKPYRISVSR